MVWRPAPDSLIDGVHHRGLHRGLPHRFLANGIKDTVRRTTLGRFCLVKPVGLFHGEPSETNSLKYAFESRKTKPILDTEYSGMARKTTVPLTNAELYVGTTKLLKGEVNERKVEDAMSNLQANISASVNGSSTRGSLPESGKKTWKFLKSSSTSLDATPSVPVPPFTGGLISLLGLVLMIGVIFDRWASHTSTRLELSNKRNVHMKSPSQIKAPTGVSIFLERDLKKESVEWVNMVIGKLWKVYRLGLESWLVGLFQPLIDNLKKPSYVKRVEIKQFYLGDEPISVRSVERRASRRANDLQYHIGIRYTGGARMLLFLKLKAGFIPITIPVGVRGLDVDGELWVKLDLVPSKPWVGTATWAFVTLPKIKLDLSPFRLFNLMEIPFLSMFLTKLLAEDLPKLFVRPKKNVINFLKGRVSGPVTKDFRGATLEGNKDFSGELSVTLVDARKLIYIPYGKTDPYVVLVLGDQVIKSKRNSQTSVIGPPGSPIWNQDFQLLVVDPKAQQLVVQVRDYFGLTAVTIGAGEVDLNTLEDTVPADRVVRLTGGWGPFRKFFAGEVLLRLTYTAYVEEEEDNLFNSTGQSLESDENSDAVPLLNEVVNKVVESVGQDSYITDMFKAVIAELDNDEPVSGDDNANFQFRNTTDESKDATTEVRAGRTLLWLGLVTGLVILVDVTLNFSNLLNP